MRKALIRVFAAGLAAAVVAGLGCSVAFAQSDPEKAVVGVRQQPQQARPAAPWGTEGGGVSRWVDLQAASLLGRYRYIETSGAAVTARQVQDSAALRGRFKFDANGYYSIMATVATGAAFTSGWNNTGIGTGEHHVSDVHVKHLALAVSPLNGVQFSAGGFGFVRGESSEVTSYDNDGYLVGERVTVTRPDLYFTEITFTNAYLGDVTTPNVFARFHRLAEPNYRQLLVARRMTGWLALSGEYARVSTVGTVRAAVTVTTRAAHVVDVLQWEQYRRGGADAAYGFGVFAEKAVTRWAIARAGYADVDRNYGGLNADRFGPGRRWYAQSDFVVSRDLTLWLFVSRAVHTSFAVPNATRVDFVATYNVMGPLRRAGVFR